MAKDDLQVKHSLPWLIYPLGYFIVAMVRGSASGFYPYPFLNVTNLGYERVMFNAFMLLIGFFAIAISMVAIAKFRRKELDSAQN